MKVLELVLETPLCNCVHLLFTDNSYIKVCCLWLQGGTFDFTIDLDATP